MVRKRSRNVRLICTIDVTGFAAVMLALLAMFTGPVMSGIDLPMHLSVDLARANNERTMPGADREDAVVIGITREGRLYLGVDRIGLDQLGGSSATD